MSGLITYAVVGNKHQTNISGKYIIRQKWSLSVIY